MGRDFWIQILEEYILKFMQIKVLLEKSFVLLLGPVEKLNANKLRCSISCFVYLGRLKLVNEALLLSLRIVLTAVLGYSKCEPKGTEAVLFLLDCL